jgi:hypothetical protein
MAPHICESLSNEPVRLIPNARHHTKERLLQFLVPIVRRRFILDHSIMVGTNKNMPPRVATRVILFQVRAVSRLIIDL